MRFYFHDSQRGDIIAPMRYRGSLWRNITVKRNRSRRIGFISAVDVICLKSRISESYKYTSSIDQVAVIVSYFQSILVQKYLV
ncbi:hypothetical protein PHET_00614 [Paragonimus heterotremus]|uniref:Uncharacterized protein n=1 Tax=Paragonimus heterotremus TaxID=100268 RepID=A0A8J4T4U7_9TREM|nr:hypothetical protein PHET_00614 [Paragonimus heterotremus]